MKKLWILCLLIVIMALLPQAAAQGGQGNLIFESVITEKHFKETTIYIEHPANGSFIAPLQTLNFRISAHDMDNYGHTVSLVKNGVVNRRYEDDGYYKIKISADVNMGESLYIKFRFDNVTFLELEYKAILDQFSFSDDEDWTWLWDEWHLGGPSGPEVIDMAQSEFERLNTVLITVGICLTAIGIAFLIVKYGLLRNLIRNNHFTKTILIGAFISFAVYQFMLINGLWGQKNLSEQQIVSFFMKSYISMVLFITFIAFYIIGYMLSRIRLKEKVYSYLDLSNRRRIDDLVVEYQKGTSIYMALQTTGDALKRMFRKVHWKISRKNNEGSLEDGMQLELEDLAPPKEIFEETEAKAPVEVVCNGGTAIDNPSDTKGWFAFLHFRSKPVPLLMCNEKPIFDTIKEEPIKLPKEAKEKIESEIHDPTKVTEIVEAIQKVGKKPKVREFIVEVDPANAHERYSDYDYATRVDTFKELEAAYREEKRGHLKTKLNTEMEATVMAKNCYDERDAALASLDERIRKKRVKKETVIEREESK